MKVFISQPFHGVKEEDVLNLREHIVDLLEERGYFDIEVIDNYYKDNAPRDAGRLWYLGDSIKLMDEADLIVFVTGYKQAKGCLIEYEVALRYGKLFIHERDLIRQC